MGAASFSFDVVYDLVLTDERYAFRGTRDGNTFVVIDNQEFGPFPTRKEEDATLPGASHVTLSGKHVAFSFRRKGKRFVRIDSEELGPFDDTIELEGFNLRGGCSIRPTPDGLGDFEPTWRVQIDGDTIGFHYKQKRKEFIWVGGKTFGPFDYVENFRIAGGHWTAIIKRKGKETVLFDGVEEGPFDTAWSPFNSGNRKGYAFRIGKENFVRIDEIKYGPYENLGGLSYSGDSWGFMAGGKDGYRVIVNGREWGPWEYVRELEVSETRFGLIHGVFRGQEVFMTLFVDGKDVGPVGEAGNLAISASHTGLILMKDLRKKGQISLWFDGREYGPFLWDFNAFFVEETNVKITPDHWGMVVVKGDPLKRVDAFVLMDGNEFGPFDKPLSPIVMNGKHWGIPFLLGRESRLLIDGKEIGPFSVDGSSPDWGSPGSLLALADKRAAFLFRRDVSGPWILWTTPLE